MKKIDRRVQKTNESLQLAFRKLAKTTSFRDITVKALTETAHINRKTFYLHYDSIEDFSNTVVDEIADKLLEVMIEKPLHETLSQSGYIIDKVFDFFRNSRDFYTLMMTSDDYSFLSRKVGSKVSAGFSEAIYQEFDISKLDAYICSSFLIRNTMMMFRLYNGNQVELDETEFRDRLLRLNSSGLSSFMDLSRKTSK